MVQLNNKNTKKEGFGHVTNITPSWQSYRSHE